MSLFEMVYVATNIICIFTIYKLFKIFFRKNSCNRKRERIILFTYFIALSGIIFVTRLPLVMLVLNILILFLNSFCYKSSLQKKIISVSLILSIMLVAELTAAACFGFFELSGLKDSTFNSISVLIFTRSFILILVHLMSRYINFTKNDFNVPLSYYFGYSVVLFGTLYLFTAQLENGNITTGNILVSGAVLIIVNITMMILDEKIYHGVTIEHEKNIYMLQNVAYEKQMEVIHQSTETIRILKHDFKNHLIMLSSMYKSNKIDEIESYINELLGNIENEIFSKSNNFVIDSILNYKLGKIKNTDINLSLEINVPMNINIETYDLTTILANLLDNAIIACEESKEKNLDIQISSKMRNLIIRINNSYSGEINQENGNFKTTKHSKSNHGLGIKSVEQTLEIYGGELQINYMNQIFSVLAIIPYK